MIDAFDVSEQDEKLLADCYAHFWQIATSTKPANRGEVEKAVAPLYEALKMSPPVVIWCDSPWQMLTMPLVLQMMNVTSNASGLKEWLRANHNSELWQHLWRVMDQHFAALQLLSCTRSKEVPSFFAPLVTGQFINKDMDWLYFTDTQDVECNDFSENQLTYIREATHDRLRSNIIPMKQQLMAKVAQDLNVGLTESLCRPINRQLRSQVVELCWLPTRPSFRRCTSQAARQALRAGVSPSLTGEQRRELEAWIRSQLDLQIRIETDNIFWAGGWGTYYLSQIEFYERHRQGKSSASSPSQRFMRWQPLSRGAQMYLFFEKVVFICDRPALLHIDEEARLHNDEAEAIRYRDGYAIYSWRGRTVPAQAIVAPETLTVDDILEERNIEVRQVLLERFSIDRFVLEAGAARRDESPYGTLWIKAIPGEAEPRAWVEVINSTPEPDGTYKHYFLRVPPNVVTAKQGIAWTFGLESSDYGPLDES